MHPCTYIVQFNLNQSYVTFLSLAIVHCHIPSNQFLLRDNLLGGIEMKGVEVGRHVSQCSKTVGVQVLVL